MLSLSLAVCQWALALTIVVGATNILEQQVPPTDDRKAVILDLARQSMAKSHLKAVILRVTIDGQDVVTEALGESLPGVPATTDMHFRNGAVAISYIATVLLQLVDEKTVSLDDTLATWMPELPE